MGDKSIIFVVILTQLFEALISSVNLINVGPKLQHMMSHHIFLVILTRFCGKTSNNLMWE